MKALLYAEDAPVREDAVGFGMEKVNGRLAEALGGNVVFTVVNERKPWSRRERLHPAVAGRAVRLRVPRLIGGEQRVQGHPLGPSAARIALWRPWLRVLAAVHAPKCVLVPVGSDPLALGRGVMLARSLKLPYAIYAVDDTPEISHCPEEFAGWVRGAARVFVLTDSLGASWASRFGIVAHEMSLPYPEPGPMPAAARTREIVFLGNVNQLYAERLVCLKAAIDRLNAANSARVVLRLTIADARTIEKLLGDLDGVVIQPCDGPGELPDLLSRALACFAPYSFEADGAVQTSFPSKTLEYLAWARTILCNGPEESSVVRFFQGEGLPLILTDPGVPALTRLLERLLADPPDHHRIYREALAARHGYSRVRKQYAAGWR